MKNSSMIRLNDINKTVLDVSKLSYVALDLDSLFEAIISIVIDQKEKIIHYPFHDTDEEKLIQRSKCQKDYDLLVEALCSIKEFEYLRDGFIKNN